MRHKLIVDNFAGGGGTSTGIEMALGRSPDIAINHDAEAIAMHQANHPNAEHFCESVWEVDIKKVIQNQAVGLVWLSPDCKHFSKAKGSKPVEKNIRGLAWIALKWAALARPDVIILENVEEFITWGPLFQDENGLYYPNSKRKGEEFRKFCNALKQQGYIIEYQVIPAYIYGAPTIRKRLYLIARLDRKSIIWTPATHGKPDSMAVRNGLLQPWRTSGECIDWSIPCPSIFDRKKPLADATCRRVANGVMKYVVNNDNPFIVGIGGGAYSRKPVPTDRPFGTIAASGNNRYLVHPVIAPHISTYYGEKSAGEVRDIPLNHPRFTQTTENRHALVTAFLTEHANASSVCTGERWTFFIGICPSGQKLYRCHWQSIG